MNRDLKVAVVGAGHLGRIHAKLLHQVSGAKLVAVCDPNAAAAKAVAAPHGVRSYNNYHDLINEIDAAVIAAPTDAHAEITQALLKANKHVFVEKPLTNDSDSARQLASLAAARRVVLQVGHVERFNPAFTALDQFGVDVKYVEAVRASRFPGRCLDVGVVLDLMIHDLDLVLSMTGAPLRHVSASGLAVVSNHEDIAEARLEFECGLVANLKASRISPLPAREMTTYSPAGFAQIDFGKPSLATVSASDSLVDRSFCLHNETENPLGYADDLFSEHLRCEVQELEPRNAILDELTDFVLSIQSGSVPMVDGSAGARAVEIADLILDAIDQRTWYQEAGADQRGPLAIVRHRIERTPLRRAA